MLFNTLNLPRYYGYQALVKKMCKKQHFSLKHWVQKIFSHMYALWHFVKCVSRLAPCKKSPVWLKNWASNDSSKLHPSKKNFASEIHNFLFLHSFPHILAITYWKYIICRAKVYMVLPAPACAGARFFWDENYRSFFSFLKML